MMARAEDMPPTGPYRVLIIDDNEAQSSGLAELLAIAGFESRYVLTGAEGLAAALSDPPDAVLLDVNLPDVSGLQVCKAIRAEPTLARTAVVFHSGARSSGTQHLGDAFITYPVETGTLAAVLRGCIARRRALR